MYDTLWVCASRTEVAARRKTFGNPASVLFINVGDCIGGIRVSEVIVDDMYADAQGIEINHITQWFDDTVRCRLTPDGSIKELRTF